MIHARSVRLAAVVVLGGAVALATSACGGPMQAGAAAVVQGQRTTDADLQGQVASIVSMDQQFGVAQGDVTDKGRVTFAQDQLTLLVQQALWQKVADEAGATVTPADDAKMHTALVEESRQQVGGAQFKGSDNEAVALAAATSQSSAPFYMAPSNVPVYAHIQALISATADALAKKLNVNPNDQSAGPALNAAVAPLVTKALGEIHYKISPRYGTFDPSSGKFLAASEPWIKQTKAQLAAAAEAQAQQTQ